MARLTDPSGSWLSITPLRWVTLAAPHDHALVDDLVVFRHAAGGGWRFQPVMWVEAPTLLNDLSMHGTWTLGASSANERARLPATMEEVFGRRRSWLAERQDTLTARDLVGLARWCRALADGVPDLQRSWLPTDGDVTIIASEVGGRVRLAVDGAFARLPRIWRRGRVSYRGFLYPRPRDLERFADELEREIATRLGPHHLVIPPGSTADQFLRYQQRVLPFRPEWTTATVSDGTTLAVAKAGSGSSVLLVHNSGYGRGGHERWRDLLPALAARFTVYGLDRRGHGRSGPYGASHRIEREVEDVVAVAESVGGPLAVVGQGDGATIAVEAAVRTPVIARLALLDPVDRPRPRHLLPEIGPPRHDDAAPLEIRDIVEGWIPGWWPVPRHRHSDTPERALAWYEPSWQAFASQPIPVLIPLPERPDPPARSELAHRLLSALPGARPHGYDADPRRRRHWHTPWEPALLAFLAGERDNP